MARFVSTSAAFAVLAAAVVLAAPAAAPFPARIDFPDGWRAEGIAAGHGNTFYAGDTATGSVFKGDVRTGEGSVLVPGVSGRSALGLTLDDWNRLWVAGGTGGGGGRHAYVYDADTGALIQDITLTTAAGFGTINDVVATRDAVWFTNTNNAANPQANVLLKVPLGTHGEIGAPETVPISFFGANGIEATPNGKTLIVVSIGQSKYYRVDVKTGETEEIVLDQAAPRGDGLILQGHTLYSVLNLPNAAFPGLTAEIAVIRLSPDYATGEVVGHLNDPNEPLVNSATADLWGNKIYVVTRNTPFGPTTFNHLARIDKNGNESPTGGAPARRARLPLRRTPRVAAESDLSMTWRRGEVWLEPELSWFREAPTVAAVAAPVPSFGAPPGLVASRVRRAAWKQRREARRARATAIALSPAVMLAVAGLRSGGDPASAPPAELPPSLESTLGAEAGRALTELQPIPPAVGAAEPDRAIEAPAEAGPTIDWHHAVSLGLPYDGRLIDGTQLPVEGPDWVTWNPVTDSSPSVPRRLYGNERTIRAIVAVTAAYRAAHPEAPRVVIGDISLEGGGPMWDEHVSHQNGLDVDVYLPRLDQTLRAPVAENQVDHLLAQDLVDRFVAAGAKVIFVGYSTGLHGPAGVVVPYPGHEYHMHVRFPRPGR